MFQSRIICIHGINRSLTRERLIRYIKWMNRLSFRFVSLSDILSGHCPSRSLALTVDDGYKNCITDLLPVLQEYHICATLFVPPGLLGLPENHEKLLTHRCYPDEGMMSWKDLEIWQENGHSIGFHTNEHVDLHEQSDEFIRQDFKKGMEQLGLHHIPINYFAYPFGFLPHNQVDFERLLADYHIKYAFTVEWGNINCQQPFYINRVCLGDREPCAWSILKTCGVIDWYYRIKKRYKSKNSFSAKP